MSTFKHLYLTAVLYLVFLVLVTRGWIDWRLSLEDTDRNR